MSYEPWSHRAPLPSVEDLPVAEQGYERVAVQQAFDSFYRHIARLDATLQTLEAVDAFQRQAGELRTELRTLRNAGWTLQPWRSYQARDLGTRAGIPPAVPRLLAEVVFLVVVAVFVGIGHFAPWIVIAAMAGAFAIVAIVEIFASRERLPARAVTAAQEELASEEAAAAEPPEPVAQPEPEPEYGWSAYAEAAGDGTGGLAVVEVSPPDEDEREEPLEEEDALVAGVPPEPEPAVEAVAAEEPAVAFAEPEPEPAVEAVAAEEPAIASAEPEPEPAAGQPQPEAVERDLAEVASDEPEQPPAEGEPAAGEPEREAVAAFEENAAAEEVPAHADDEAPVVEPAAEAEEAARSAEEQESELEAPTEEPVAHALSAPAAAGMHEAAGEGESVAAEADSVAEPPEPSPEPEAKPESWPGGEDVADDGRRRRWFGRKRGRPAEEPPPQAYEPPSHVRVLPPADRADDPWERGFDETLEPLGYVEESDDDVEPPDDTEGEPAPRRLRRRHR